MRLFLPVLLNTLIAFSILISTTGCPKSPAPETPEPIDLSKAQDVFSQAAPPAPPEKKDPLAVVATVDGTAITQQELDKEIVKFMQRIGRRMPPEQLAQRKPLIEKQSLESLITRQLLLGAVEIEKVSVTDEDIDKKIAELVETVPGVKSLEELLGQAKMTEEAFKQDLKTEMRIVRLLESKVEGISEPDEKAVEEFYTTNKKNFDVPETVTAEHLAVRLQPGATAEDKPKKKELAESLRGKLVAGGVLTNILAEVSDQDKSVQGGQAEFARGRMPAELEEVVFKQEVDAVGQVVESQFGFHVFKVLEHTEPRTLTLDEAKEQISKILSNKEKQKAMQGYLQDLQAKADIQIKQ